MLRRTQRLRRHYLHQRHQRHAEALLRQKRGLLKDALEHDRPLPPAIRADAQLARDYRFDEGLDAQDPDDEYGGLGDRPPSVLITTSRKPSSRLQQFAKEVRLLVPNARRMNRGSAVIQDIVAACRSGGVTDLIILHETRGTPDCLIVTHFPHGPTASFTLHNVVLRHDIPGIGSVSESHPRLVMLNLTSELGLRVEKILKALFPPNPKENSPRVITFANQRDYISLRHHVYVRTDAKNVELAEVGPRFEMRLFEIKLGTVESSTAEIEWSLRPYHRHKSFVLSEA